MIVARFKQPPMRLMAKADEADGGGGLDLSEDDDGSDDGGDDTQEGGDGADKVDRGDVVTGTEQPSSKALKKVAGEEGDDTAVGGEGEDTVEGGGKGTSDHVPIGRFNKVNEEKKQLAARVAELEKERPAATPAPTPAPPTFDRKKAEREYADLLADGKFDEAVELREKINDHIQAAAEEKAIARVGMQRVSESLAEVANQALKDHPWLDEPEHAETMQMIIALRDVKAAGGMPLPKALKAAVDTIAPKFKPEGAGTPGKESTQEGKDKDTREQAATRRGAEASGKQPPLAQGGAGNRQGADKVDVEEMTDEQFSALSAAEKKRLRGDAS